MYHGHTLTSKIRFEDVVKGIREHGFDHSPYPIILSFENHCTEPYQKKMATYIKKHLSDVLYQVKQDSENYHAYPSPEALKGKVIIKGKGSFSKVMDYLYPNREQKRRSKNKK